MRNFKLFFRFFLAVIAGLAFQWAASSWAGDFPAQNPSDRLSVSGTTSRNQVNFTRIFGKNKAQKAKTVFANPKLTAPDAMLSDFMNNQARTRVIINLKNTDKAAHRKRIKTTQGRKLAGQLARQAQDTVLSRMDANEVLTHTRFTLNYGFAASVTLEGLSQLEDDPDVVSIEADKINYAHGKQAIPLMSATLARSEYGGTGIGIAILDTGINYTHPMLGNGTFPNDKVLGGYDFGDNDSDPIDTYYHGTACAGIAAGSIPASITTDYIGGVAPDAKLFALKISTGSSNSAYTSDMVEAINWCVTNQHTYSCPIMIISLSFGSGGYDSVCDATESSMTAAAQNANDAGITIFVSSGNDGYCDAISSPACISNMISVGAVYDNYLGSLAFCVNEDSCANISSNSDCSTGYAATDKANEDVVTSYSNTASFLDLLAPSHNNYTTTLGGSYKSTFGGTSAACPNAAGAAAVLQSAAKALLGDYLTPDQVRAIMTETGDAVTDGKVTITKPRVNLEAAVALASMGDVEFTAASGTLCFYEDNTTTFTGIAQGSPATWEWAFSPDTVTFLDATSESSQNPVVQFDEPGTYSVSLSVAYESGTEAVHTKEDYIAVYNQCQDIVFELETNRSRSQISWALENTDEQILYSDGPYTLSQGETLEKSISFSLPSGSYTFTICDDGGPYLYTPSWIATSYSLTKEDRNETIVSNSDFTDEESTAFTLTRLTDTDTDGDVDGKDLFTFIQNHAAGNLPDGDLNSDEQIDDLDIKTFVSDFGN